MINDSYILKGVTIPNRAVFQPMEGCDCNADGSPIELTIQKYIKAAESGVGIVWFEANAVCPEGRTNAGQMMLTAENADKFRALLSEMREIARKKTGIRQLFVLQLTHSGRQSIVPMIAYRNSVYEHKRPMTDENIVTDEYLDTLPALYANSARLAKYVGFDAVDVKACHGYLLAELLSAFSREGRYGGSFENRARLYFDCAEAVNNAVGDSLIIGARLGLSDMVAKPNGFGTNEQGELDLTESDMLVEGLMARGVSIINVTVGNPYFNPHINRPFKRGGYVPPEEPAVGLARFVTVQKHLKERFPTLAVVGSGLSYYRKELMEVSESILCAGVCDFVGYGRVSLAYPGLYVDYLKGEFDYKKCCVACSKCTELMRAKCVSGCAVFNDYYKKLYEEKVVCKK